MASMLELCVYHIEKVMPQADISSTISRGLKCPIKLRGTIKHIVDRLRSYSEKAKALEEKE